MTHNEKTALSEKTVLSVDVGSSSVRATLYDAGGDPIVDTDTKLDYEFEHDAEGAAVTGAEALFDLVVRAIDGALSGEGGEAAISAVAMSTFWHSLVGLDREGDPTTPVITWADRRAADDARRLRERLDEAAIHRRTGAVLHSSYWPAKLAWLGRAHPEIFESSERWVSPGDYFYGRLFGSHAEGTSMASATGLFDQNEVAWDRELVEALPIDGAQLSPISDEPREGLGSEWAERWPALRGVPWYAAAGDGACSNIGSGCTTNERLALMVGTSGAMRVLWRADSVSIPDGPWCYRSDPDRFVMGGALSNGGNLVAWLRDTLRLPDEEETEREISKMEPDSHGLTFLPLLAGERGPGWADLANGTIAGLSMSSTPLEILRAAMESVAYRFALIAEMLEEAIPGDKEVIATGGGLLGSPTWTQIMADTLGRPLTVSRVEEASSRGAALLALENLGELRIESLPAPLGETFEPDPGRHEVYSEALARQQRLYEAVLGG